MSPGAGTWAADGTGDCPVDFGAHGPAGAHPDSTTTGRGLVWRPRPRAARRRDTGARRQTAAAWGLAAFLAAAGTAHFVVPEPYQRIVPRVLNDPAFWVWSSGWAEIGCAVLVANPRTRRLGASFAVALFVVVFPANVQMAIDGGIPGQPFPWGSPVVAWLRLPLQIPLVVWAWRVGRPQTGELSLPRGSRRRPPSGRRRPRRSAGG